jgi:hypothetical protein
MRDRTEGWVGFFRPVGIYAIFSLQFLIPSAFVFGVVAGWMKPFGIVIDGSVDRPLLIALIFFVPFVFVMWGLQKFFRDFYERITILSRMDDFESAVGKFTRYHKKSPVEQMLDSLDRGTHADARKKVINVMIDILITDLRDAFQDLCVWPDIRVAIYVESLETVSYNKKETVLHMISSTEFDKEYELSTKFRKVNTTDKYEGYCGHAWNTGLPTCGTYRRFFFWTDKTFFCGNVLDKGRSFLCLPITRSDTTGEPVLAVLSIDSGRRYDLLLSRDLVQTIGIKTTNIRSILAHYLSLLQFELE